MDRRIVLYGRSVALNSITAALATLPGLELLCAPVASETAAEVVAHILTFGPSAVIFDLAAGLPDTELLRLLAHQRVTLLGFDLESQHMLVLSGEHQQLQTLDDLARVLALTPEEGPCSHSSR